LPAARWFFIPLKGPKGVISLLAVTGVTREDEEEFFLPPAQKRMLNSFCDQAALAIDRAQMAEDIEDSRILSETERLRSALLSSLSNDLSKPLVGITTQAHILQNRESIMDSNERAMHVRLILDHAERLNRFIQNLLDMTKLGHGGLVPRREWVPTRVLIDRAVQFFDKEMASFTIKVEIGPEVTSLHVDADLMRRVLINVLDNIVEYVPHGSLVVITAKRAGKRVELIIADEGPGIPEKERTLVFDMFYRVRQPEIDVAGTGLGLAICKGIIEAHGGSIEAQNGLDGKGLSIVMSFPLTMAGGAEIAA
jgi:two-component system sensor histidine kinase KdpD